MESFHFLKKIKLPKKSIFGFKLLSSKESSLSAYFLNFLILLLSPYFGNSPKEITASLLFNIIAITSILILNLNLFLKRREIKKSFFWIINFPLFLYLPINLFDLIKNIIFLIKGNLYYSI